MTTLSLSLTGGVRVRIRIHLFHLPASLPSITDPVAGSPALSATYWLTCPLWQLARYDGACQRWGGPSIRGGEILGWMDQGRWSADEWTGGPTIDRVGPVDDADQKPERQAALEIHESTCDFARLFHFPNSPRLQIHKQCHQDKSTTRYSAVWHYTIHFSIKLNNDTVIQVIVSVMGSVKSTLFCYSWWSHNTKCSS